MTNSNIELNLTVGETNGYFIMGSEYITFNGNSNIVTINNIANYQGLIRNGTSLSTAQSPAKTNIIIQNIGVETSGSTTLVNSGGWICQSYFGSYISTGTIQVSNCYSTGTIGSYAGVIFGSLTANLATGSTLTCNAYYCYVIGGSLIFGGNSNNTIVPPYISLSYCIWIGTNGKTSDIISSTYQTQGTTWIDANAQLTINQTNSSVSPTINPHWVILNTN